MTTFTETIKQEIRIKIEKLSEHKLLEVLDFVSFLLFKENSHLFEQKKLNTDLDPQKNPLLQFIGAVSHGALAQDIDKEVYGQ